MQKNKLIYSLVGILILAFGGLFVTLVANNTPSLGLDLQGGISITQQPVGDFNTASLDLAVERIRERVDSLGVAEPEILRQGDAIVVNLPGVKNQKQAEELVKVTGQVYLRPVLIDDQFNIPCVTGDPNRNRATTDTTTTIAGATTTAAASGTTTTGVTTTTAAGGPSRRTSTTNTSTTAPPTTVSAGAPTTTVAAGTTGATTTTVAGDTSNTLPAVPPESSGFVAARGGASARSGLQVAPARCSRTTRPPESSPDRVGVSP